MKKIYSLVAAALFCGLTVNAQDYELRWDESAEEAIANHGYTAHSWGAGYVLPGNTVLMDNDYLTITNTVDCGIFPQSWMHSVGSDLGYNNYMYFGSQKNNNESGAYDDIYTVEGIARTDHGILQITAKQSGRMTASFSMGNNNRTCYVYRLGTETEIAEGFYGMYVLASATDAAGVHTVAFNVQAGRDYLLVGSGSGNQLYSVTYTAPDADAGKYQTVDLPTSPYTIVQWSEDADAVIAEKGYSAHSWGAGYVLPANTEIYSDNDITVTNMVDCGIFPSSWFHDVAKDTEYNNYMYFGSQLDNNQKDDIYTASSVARSDHGIISVKVNTSGRIVLVYSNGGNNRTCYVYRVGTETEQTAGVYGMYVLSNFTDTKGIHTPAFDVVAGNEYLIVDSGSGNQLYAIGFANAETQASGIDNVNVNNVTKIADNKVYSIDGRYVGNTTDNLSKGLYIMNGKKFVVK